MMNPSTSAMQRVTIWFAAIAGTVCLTLTAQTPPPGPTARLDPAFDAIVSPGTALEIVKDGFAFINGIVWVKDSEFAPGFTFGDSDGKTLYMAASTKLARIRVNIAGAR